MGKAADWERVDLPMNSVSLGHTAASKVSAVTFEMTELSMRMKLPV